MLLNMHGHENTNNLRTECTVRSRMRFCFFQLIRNISLFPAPNAHKSFKNAQESIFEICQIISRFLHFASTFHGLEKYAQNSLNIRPDVKAFNKIYVLTFVFQASSCKVVQDVRVDNVHKHQAMEF